MTGVDIIAALLAASDPLLALTPVEKIKAGLLPEGVKPPSILLRTVSVVDFQLLADEPKERLVERVAVMVRAANYDQQRDLIRLVRRACKGKTGTIAGAEKCSVLPAGTGPDMIGPTNTFDQVQDFRVSYQRDA